VPTDEQPRWRDEAGLTAWARERLDAVGLSPSGAPERYKARPWGSVLRWDLPSGRWWLKATGPGLRHEPALVAALARWAPQHVLTPVAVEPRRGWLVLPDGGPTLRERYGDEHDLGHWERLLPSYAHLQREVAPHVEEMLAVGVPDLRVEQLMAELDAALALDAHALGVGAEDGPTAEELDLVRAARPQIAAWVDELASYRLPVSVQHDDVHDANVFASVDGNLRVFDWGDASVAPVVTSLLIALRVAARLLELPSGSPELLRLLDAYLEVWSDLVPAEDLRAATAVALRLGAISRSRCYVRSLLDASPDEAEPYRGAVGGWLVELLGPTPLDPPA
jgi:hypothetical protein